MGFNEVQKARRHYENGLNFGVDDRLQNLESPGGERQDMGREGKEINSCDHAKRRQWRRATRGSEAEGASGHARE